MSIFAKLYLTLLFTVVAVLFYGISVRAKLQLNSIVRTESVHQDKPTGSAQPTGSTGTGAGAAVAAINNPVLNDFFPAQTLGAVPEDDTMGPIGSCPPSKPFSTDLPLIDIPLSVAKSQNNMRLAAVDKK